MLISVAALAAVALFYLGFFAGQKQGKAPQMEASNSAKWEPSPTISAIMLGALMGLMIGFFNSARGPREDIGYWLDREGGDAAVWALLGAFITFCAIYASRLPRK
jgi:hypothetical protein